MVAKFTEKGKETFEHGNALFSFTNVEGLDGDRTFEFIQVRKLSDNGKGQKLTIPKSAVDKVIKALTDLQK